MKKLLPILALSILIFSCSNDSSDDDGGDNNPCPQPTSLSINSLTNTTARLDWSSQVQSSLYDVEYGIIGFSQGSGIRQTVPNAYLYIENLTPTTQYSFYVRVFCQSTNGYSNWAGPYTFVTLDNNPYCEDPSNLHVRPYNDSVTHEHIDLSWSDGDFDGSQIQYGIEGFTIGNGAIVIIDDTIYPSNARIDGLNANTSYDFYVRNQCGDTGYSSWIGPVTQSTLEEPLNPNCIDPLNFTLDQIYTTTGGADVLVFSWDEMNGENTWQIHKTVNGNPIGSGTTLDTSYNPIQLTNHTSTGVVYDFYVRANCGIDGYSDWVGPITITGP